jgi:RNA polymerase sigma factor for flagellar operon FliA
VRRLAHRHRLPNDQAEELLGAMHLKLVENDYEVLRRFQGRSSLATYLTSIVARHLIDERNARWGKWRPSIYAKRHGAVAMHLEMLMTRDGLPFREAVQVLRSNVRVIEAEDVLYQISLGFPERTTRRFVGIESIEHLPHPDSADDEMERRRRAAIATKTSAALQAALATLHAEDRLLLRLCFEEGLPLSEVARSLQLEHKPLYRRRAHVFAVLRRELERHGIGRDEIQDITRGDLDSEEEGD